MKEYENALKAIATGNVRKTIAMGLCNFSYIRCNTDLFQECVRLGYATYNPKSIDYKRGTANYCTLIYEHQGFELKIKSNGLIDLCEDITYFDYEDLTVKWNTVVQSDLKVSNLNKFLNYNYIL